MKLRVWAAVFIFIGSYLPLSLILLAQDFDYQALGSKICIDFWSQGSRCELPFAHPALSISIFAVCFTCLLFTVFVLQAVQAKRPIKILSRTHIPSELMNYTLPYVVSFMGVGYNETGKFVGIIIFLAWMFWITYKSGQIILNPILPVFGWRLYEIEYSYIGGKNTFTASALIQGELDDGGLAQHEYIQEIMIVRAKLMKSGERGPNDRT